MTHRHISSVVPCCSIWENRREWGSSNSGGNDDEDDDEEEDEVVTPPECPIGHCCSFFVPRRERVPARKRKMISPNNNKKHSKNVSRISMPGRSLFEDPQEHTVPSTCAPRK